MTQKEKTLLAREAFFDAMKAANISGEDFTKIASTATTWVIENFNEGLDTGRDIGKRYAVTATATHDGTATIVEPVTCNDHTPSTHSANA